MLRNIGRKAGKENNESFKLLLLITFFYRGKKIFLNLQWYRENYKNLY